MHPGGDAATAANPVGWPSVRSRWRAGRLGPAQWRSFACAGPTRSKKHFCLFVLDLAVALFHVWRWWRAREALLRGKAAPPDPRLRHDDKRQTREKALFACGRTKGEGRPSSCVGPGANEPQRLALHGRGLASQRTDSAFESKKDSRQLAVLDSRARH